MMPTILRFRRDLRLTDHPALLAACEAGGDAVLPLFVLDPRLWEAAGEPRRAYLTASLRDLDERPDGRLTVRAGDPVEVVPQVAREVEARAVHVTADCGAYGSARDRSVEEALEVPLVRTGSPYAVTPGRVLTQQGDPYRVFTPFLRSWAEHGWREFHADVLHHHPGGDYVRRWVPEIDQPGYPEPIADHAAERREALDRWEQIT